MNYTFHHDAMPEAPRLQHGVHLLIHTVPPEAKEGDTVVLMIVPRSQRVRLIGDPEPIPGTDKFRTRILVEDVAEITISIGDAPPVSN